MAAAEAKKVSESVFTKEQIMKSKIYENRKDILDVVLEEGKTYTKAQAKEKVEKFLKGKVK